MKRGIIGILIVSSVLGIIALLCVMLRRPGITVSLAGDVFLARGMEDKISKYGMDYPYEKVRKIFLDSDISFANLECPLTDAGKPSIKKKIYVFREDGQNAFALKRAGLDVLSLANNHSMDYGSQGLTDTMNYLKKAGVLYAGAGTNKEEAHKPLFISKSGITVGFLSYSEFPPEGYIHFDDKPDVAFLDKESLSNEIKAAKAMCDWLIVSFHWGKEFSKSSSEAQKSIAHQAVDSGADFIAGHHPHVLQEVEEYKNKMIFYSLGNLTFDKTSPEGVDRSAIASITLSKKRMLGCRMIPIQITDCQARPVK